jgi:DNA-binding transcriptional LysR family regulator
MNLNISMRQLKVFQAVVAQRNFSRAGERIGLSQPAVSRAVREMEEQLGVRLLDRSTREVAPTEAGMRLAGHLDRLLDELDLALQEVRGLAQDRRGRVRVASAPTLSASLMPRCIAACARELPGVEMLMLDRIQQDVLDSVRSGEVDFGVVIDPASPDDLHTETILREPFCLVCPADHPLARRSTVAWKLLAGHPLVLLDHASGSRRLIDSALNRYVPPGDRSEGAPPTGVASTSARVVQQLGHPATVFRMVEAGIGITVLPTLALAPAVPAGLVARLLTPRMDRSVMLVHRLRRGLSPVAADAWDLVRRTAAALPPALEGLGLRADGARAPVGPRPPRG